MAEAGVMPGTALLGAIHGLWVWVEVKPGDGVQEEGGEGGLPVVEEVFDVGSALVREGEGCEEVVQGKGYKGAEEETKV